MSEPATHEDKFIAMVTAKAEVDLRLSDFHPRSMLVTPVHDLKRAKFPAVDYHNHLDAQDPAAVLKVMDECGIERIVNITMQVGNEALAVIKRFHSSAPGRFATFAWMDWTDLHRADFFSHCADRLEMMVEHGACGLKVWKDLGTSLRDSTRRFVAGRRRTARADVRESGRVERAGHVSHGRPGRVFHARR